MKKPIFNIVRLLRHFAPRNDGIVSARVRQNPWQSLVFQGLFLLLTLATIATVLYFTLKQPTPKAEANNIAVTNISVATNASTGKATISFVVNWDNSYSSTFDGQVFYDTAWIFAKYSTNGGADGSWNHATLTTGGTLTPSPDNKGTFANPRTTAQSLVWNYTADGVANGSGAKLKIMAIEMVRIPTGQFWYKSGCVNNCNTPADIGGGSEILITDSTSTAFLPTGASAGWPNGYNSFYIAKYEVSEGQYVDFLNTLSSTQAASRYDITLYGQYRYNINYTAGNAYGARYTTTTPNRACNYVSWDDMKTYLSWSALRPMTEMEFEKAGRGSSIQGTNKRIWPWGDTDPSTGNADYTADGAANVEKYFANYNSHVQGPVSVGLYLSKDIVRTNAQTGASPYGVTDLAGNDWEHIMNTTWTQTPTQGNGSLTPPGTWPGNTAAKGLRGGGWGDDSSYLRVGDRVYATWSVSSRNIHVGLRPARDYY